MKKALLIALVVLVIVTGIPVPLAATGAMGCQACLPGVLATAATCLAVLASAVALAIAALMAMVGAASRPPGGRTRAAPLLRPPRLA